MFQRRNGLCNFAFKLVFNTNVSIIKPMKFRLAMGGLLCLGLMSGSAYAVTAGKDLPAAAAATPAEPSNDNADANAPADEQQDTNPYASIIRANVFHLQDPPKPIEKPNEVLLNLPKVNITGFRKREGEPLRALFASVPKDPKESPSYFNLAEGEKDGILELKHIDPDQESVEVILAGTPTTLTVKSNSFVQPIVIPKGGIPGQPMPNPGIVARPPMAPVPTPAPVAQPANPYSGGVIVAGGGTPAPAVGGNPPPTYGNNGLPQQNPGMVNPAVAEQNALRSIPTRGGTSPIPTRGIRTPNYTPGQYQPQTLDEARVHAAVYQEMNAGAIQNNEAPPPPPFQQ